MPPQPQPINLKDKSPEELQNLRDLTIAQKALAIAQNKVVQDNLVRQLATQDKNIASIDAMITEITLESTNSLAQAKLAVQ